MLNVSTKIFQAISLLKPYDIDVAKRMVGSERDGAYIIADNLGLSDIMSVGVDHNDDFDLAMAEAGHQIFMFDHTVEGPPHKHERFHFQKIGVCGPHNAAPDLLTLEQMIANCSLGNNLILKIDVEGAEWEVFSTIPHHVLARFDQILVEIHWLENLRDGKFRWLSARRSGVSIRNSLYFMCTGTTIAKSRSSTALRSSACWSFLISEQASCSRGRHRQSIRAGQTGQTTLRTMICHCCSTRSCRALSTPPK